jgi:hypothetical protein
VFTVEPGLYYPSKGYGVRIEDTYWCRPDGQFESLTDFSKEIRAFLEEWSDKRVPRERIQHLDVSCKEKFRIGFFEETLSRVEVRADQESKHGSKH